MSESVPRPPLGAVCIEHNGSVDERQTKTAAFERYWPCAWCTWAILERREMFFRTGQQLEPSIHHTRDDVARHAAQLTCRSTHQADNCLAQGGRIGSTYHRTRGDLCRFDSHWPLVIRRGDPVDQNAGIHVLCALMILLVPRRKCGALLTEFTETPKRLLHLFECTPPVRFVREPILEEQANITVGDAHWRPELMGEHMQDVININRHATRETNTPAPACGDRGGRCVARRLK